MLSALRADPEPALSDCELDLADWGFTYGVAWARVRERQGGEGDDAVAGDALDAARRVFHAYTDGADWKQRIEERASRAAGAGRWARRRSDRALALAALHLVELACGSSR